MNTQPISISLKLFIALTSLLFCFTTSYATPTAQCLAPPSGMVGWWPGDQNPNDIIGTNNGVFTGGSYITGEVGNAFTFSGTGTDYVLIPQNASLESQAVTVDAWVRANGTPGQFKYIVAKGGNGCSGGSSYALYTSGSQGLRFYVYDGNNFVLSPDFGTGVWDNQWHHVAGSYDGQNVKLYVDGNLIGSTPTTLAINYNLSNNNLVIGNYLDCNSGQNFAFKGDVDEVEVFNHALSDSEIHNIYAAGSAGKCKAITANIDVIPLSLSHCINPKNTNEVFPTIIYGAQNLNVRNINLSTVQLNGLSILGNNTPLCLIANLNRDNFLDMLCLFRNNSSAWINNNTTATLTGKLFDNTPFIGKEMICLMPKK